MTEVFRKYGGGEPRPDDKAPIACTVRHPEAGGQCEREAIGEVWSLSFCEVHGNFIQDAEEEGDQELVEFFDGVLENNLKAAQRAKEMLVPRVQQEQE